MSKNYNENEYYRKHKSIPFLDYNLEIKKIKKVKRATSLEVKQRDTSEDSAASLLDNNRSRANPNADDTEPPLSPGKDKPLQQTQATAMTLSKNNNFFLRMIKLFQYSNPCIDE